MVIKLKMKMKVASVGPSDLLSDSLRMTEGVPESVKKGKKLFPFLTTANFHLHRASFAEKILALI